MSEIELLQAFLKERSEDAFAHLVRRYAGLVYSTAKRRLANPSLAEDITQIVFIRFAKKPPKVRSPAELAAWLHRTTVNVSIDLWRSETRRRARELAVVVMESPTPETVVWEEISPKLDDALNQLADEDRHTLLLRFFSEKTMRELGATLGISEDAVKMRVNRAVDRLRTQMGVRAAACTAAMLCALLAEHSVEAAPGNLASRLSSIKLPAAGLPGAGGLFGTLSRIPNLKIAAGPLVMALLAVVAIRLLNSANRPVATATTAQVQPPVLRNSDDAADYKQFQAFAQASQIADTNVYFHIVDAETRGPLAEAKIHASFFTGNKYVNRDFVADSRGIATVPERIEITKNSGIRFYAIADGHVPKAVLFAYFFSQGPRPIPPEYTMDLYPATTVRGIIEDEQGQPVSGVRIMIQDSGIEAGAMFNQEQQVDFDACPVTSGGDGAWSYSYVPLYFTNQIPFLLTKPGYATTLIVVPVADADLNNLVLVINRGFTVSGQVVDAQQQPISEARVQTLGSFPGKEHLAKADDDGVFVLTNISGIAPYEIPQTETIQTNENGELNGVPCFSQTASLETNESGAVSLHEWKGYTRSVELGIRAKGFAPQTRTVDLSGFTNTVNFTLLPGNILRGRVQDDDGNPIAKAHMEASWNNDSSLGTEWQGQTDTSGQFTWNHAPAGPISFDISAEGYQPQFAVSLAADGSDHDITLERVATP